MFSAVLLAGRRAERREQGNRGIRCRKMTLNLQLRQEYLRWLPRRRSTQDCSVKATVAAGWGSRLRPTWGLIACRSLQTHDDSE